MDANRFDRIARSLTGLSSRRRLLRGLPSAAIGLAAVLPVIADAKNRRPRKKPPTFNMFGCQDVGGRCSGRDGYCCSGLCAGKAPKQGEKDNSRCLAHHTGGCEPNHDHCDATFPCTTSAGNPGECGFTTGRAGFCFALSRPDLTCRRDPECQQILGAASACVWCASTGATHCVGLQ